MILILLMVVTTNDTIFSEIITDLGYDQDVAKSAISFYRTINIDSVKITDVKEKIRLIARKIKKEVKVQNLPCDTDGAFELYDVFRYREGNCLGMTLLFYVYAKKLGYDIHGMIGKNHIANLILFDDSLYFFVDLAATPGPFISEPFILNAVFRQINSNYYRLVNEKFFPTDEMKRIFKHVQLLDNNGIISALYYNRGLVTANKENLNQAIKYFNKALEFNPHFAEAYANKGKALLLLNRDDEAKETLDRAIKFNPLIASAYVDRATVYFRKGFINKSIEDCNAAINLNPQIAEAFITRGNGYNRLKKYQLAIEDYNQALKIAPDRYEAFLNRGISYAAISAYVKAITDYNQALSINPQLVEAYQNRGDAYYQLKRYRSAIKDYNKAIEINPDSWSLYFNRGNCYFHLGEYQSALADFERTIVINPDLTEAYLNRGIIYYNLREMDKAKEDFRIVYKMDVTIFLNFYNDIKRHGKSYLLWMLDKIKADS